MLLKIISEEMKEMYKFDDFKMTSGELATKTQFFFLGGLQFSSFQV